SGTSSGTSSDDGSTGSTLVPGDIIDTRGTDAETEHVEIYSVAPTSGVVGSLITLSGAGFGENNEGTYLSVGGSEAHIEAWSNNEIIAAIPDLPPNDHVITIATSDGTLSSTEFSVTFPSMIYTIGAASQSFTRLSALRFNPTTGAVVELAQSPFSTGELASVHTRCGQVLALRQETRHLFLANRT